MARKEVYGTEEPFVLGWHASPPRRLVDALFPKCLSKQECLLEKDQWRSMLVPCNLGLTVKTLAPDVGNYLGKGSG